MLLATLKYMHTFLITVLIFNKNNFKYSTLKIVAIQQQQLYLRNIIRKVFKFAASAYMLFAKPKIMLLLYNLGF